MIDYLVYQRCREGRWPVSQRSLDTRELSLRERLLYAPPYGDPPADVALCTAPPFYQQCTTHTPPVLSAVPLSRGCPSPEGPAECLGCFASALSEPEYWGFRNAIVYCFIPLGLASERTTFLLVLGGLCLPHPSRFKLRAWSSGLLQAQIKTDSEFKIRSEGRSVVAAELKYGPHRETAVTLTLVAEPFPPLTVFLSGIRSCFQGSVARCGLEQASVFPGARVSSLK